MSQTEFQTHSTSSPFPKTSVTLHERILADTPDADAALEEFFQRYWYPLYAFLRALGVARFEAEDLVQGFVTSELLEREQLKEWDPDKGQLRTFLKVAIDRFRMKVFRKETALKRGGARHNHVSMDFDWAENRFEHTALLEAETPETLYMKEWAKMTADRAISLLATKYSEKGRLREFNLLVRNLRARVGMDEDVTYREIAIELEMEENNVKQRMSELRKLLKRYLRKIVSESVPAEELEEEVEFVYAIATGHLSF